MTRSMYLFIDHQVVTICVFNDFNNEDVDDPYPERARTAERVKRRKGESGTKLEHKKQQFRSE